MSEEIKEELLQALEGAARASGPRQALWSNVEIFEGWNAPNATHPNGSICEYPTACGRHPAPIARIVAQLESEDPYVVGHVAWEWSTCLSPFTSADTSLLSDDYAAYVGAPQRILHSAR